MWHLRSIFVHFCHVQSYLEAVNKETLKNAFSRLEDFGVLEQNRVKGRDVTVALNVDWMPERDIDGNIVPRGRLWDLVERIGQYRYDLLQDMRRLS